MPREVRRVPGNWEHPRNGRGHYLRLRGGSYREKAAIWDEEAKQWENGFYRADAKSVWLPKTTTMTGSYEEFDGQRPIKDDYMPDWPASERTHFQKYESTTEGTPVSPVFESQEALDHWLDEHGEYY